MWSDPLNSWLPSGSVRHEAKMSKRNQNNERRLGLQAVQKSNSWPTGTNYLQDLWMNYSLMFSVILKNIPVTPRLQKCVYACADCGMTLQVFALSVLLISSTACLGKRPSYDKCDTKCTSVPTLVRTIIASAPTPNAFCCSCHRSVCTPEQNGAPFRY